MRRRRGAGGLVSLARGAAGYALSGVEVNARLRTGGIEGHAMGAQHARRVALLREGVEGYLRPGLPL